ncbi:hypothetical protein ADUPG1_007870, partial [Aduncisulcus paluster]
MLIPTLTKRDMIRTKRRININKKEILSFEGVFALYSAFKFSFTKFKLPEDMSPVDSLFHDLRKYYPLYFCDKSLSKQASKQSSISSKITNSTILSTKIPILPWKERLKMIEKQKSTMEQNRDVFEWCVEQIMKQKAIIEAKKQHIREQHRKERRKMWFEFDKQSEELKSKVDSSEIVPCEETKKDEEEEGDYSSVPPSIGTKSSYSLLHFPVFRHSHSHTLLGTPTRDIPFSFCELSALSLPFRADMIADNPLSRRLLYDSHRSIMKSPFSYPLSSSFLPSAIHPSSTPIPSDYFSNVTSNPHFFQFRTIQPKVDKSSGCVYLADPEGFLASETLLDARHEPIPASSMAPLGEFRRELECEAQKAKALLALTETRALPIYKRASTCVMNEGSSVKFMEKVLDFCSKNTILSDTSPKSRRGLWPLKMLDNSFTRVQNDVKQKPKEKNCIIVLLWAANKKNLYLLDYSPISQVEWKTHSHKHLKKKTITYIDEPVIIGDVSAWKCQDQIHTHDEDISHKKDDKNETDESFIKDLKLDTSHHSLTHKTSRIKGQSSINNPYMSSSSSPFQSSITFEGISGQTIQHHSYTYHPPLTQKELDEETAILEEKVKKQTQSSHHPKIAQSFSPSLGMAPILKLESHETSHSHPSGDISPSPLLIKASTSIFNNNTGNIDGNNISSYNIDIIDKTFNRREHSSSTRHQMPSPKIMDTKPHFLTIDSKSILCKHLPKHYYPYLSKIPFDLFRFPPISVSRAKREILGLRKCPADVFSKIKQSQERPDEVSHFVDINDLKSSLHELSTHFFHATSPWSFIISILPLIHSVRILYYLRQLVDYAELKQDNQTSPTSLNFKSLRRECRAQGIRWSCGFSSICSLVCALQLVDYAELKQDNQTSPTSLNFKSLRRECRAQGIRWSCGFSSICSLVCALYEIALDIFPLNGLLLSHYSVFLFSFKPERALFYLRKTAEVKMKLPIDLRTTIYSVHELHKLSQIRSDAIGVKQGKNLRRIKHLVTSGVSQLKNLWGIFVHSSQASNEVYQLSHGSDAEAKSQHFHPVSPCPHVSNSIRDMKGKRRETGSDSKRNQHSSMSSSKGDDEDILRSQHITPFSDPITQTPITIAQSTLSPVQSVGILSLTTHYPSHQISSPCRTSDHHEGSQKIISDKSTISQPFQKSPSRSVTEFGTMVKPTPISSLSSVSPSLKEGFMMPQMPLLQSIPNTQKRTTESEDLVRNVDIIDNFEEIYDRTTAERNRITFKKATKSTPLKQPFLSASLRHSKGPQQSPRVHISGTFEVLSMSESGHRSAPYEIIASRPVHSTSSSSSETPDLISIILSSSNESKHRHNPKNSHYPVVLGSTRKTRGTVVLIRSDV